MKSMACLASPVVSATSPATIFPRPWLARQLAVRCPMALRGGRSCRAVTVDRAGQGSRRAIGPAGWSPLAGCIGTSSGSGCTVPGVARLTERAFMIRANRKSLRRCHPRSLLLTSEDSRSTTLAAMPCFTATRMNRACSLLGVSQRGHFTSTRRTVSASQMTRSGHPPASGETLRS